MKALSGNPLQTANNRYYAVYEYSWRGIKHRVRSNSSFVGIGNEGDKCTLLINPDDPECIYELNNEKSRIRKQLIIGIVMMILGTVLLGPIIITIFKSI